MKPYKVTETGEKILEIMSGDAKATPEDIARQLDLPEKEVARQIKKFEKDRVIIGYETHINWQRIKQHSVKALIEVKVIPERSRGFDTVAESIYRYPEVKSVSLLSGTYDLLVEVEVETLRDVSIFVFEKLATVHGVQSTVSHFLMKKYKENGVVLVDMHDSKRLPVSP